jgi:hypothetical protein
MINPFTGQYIEYGQATSADYDEAEQDQENFAKAQIDFEEEKEKQKEAKEQRESDDDDDDDNDKGGGNKQSSQTQSAAATSSPDDGDGEGGGRGATYSKPGRFHWERLGGLLVFDPPSHDSAASSDSDGYDPSSVSSVAFEPVGDGGGAAARPVEAGPKVDPSQITDPDQEQVGKEAADKEL